MSKRRTPPEAKWVTGDHLADLCQRLMVQCVYSNVPPTRGCSKFYRHLVRSTRTEPRAIIALDNLYEAAYARRALLNMARDLYTFCSYTGRTLWRVTKLNRDLNGHAHIRLLFEFNMPRCLMRPRDSRRSHAVA